MLQQFQKKTLVDELEVVQHELFVCDKRRTDVCIPNKNAYEKTQK